MRPAPHLLQVFQCGAGSRTLALQLSQPAHQHLLLAHHSLEFTLYVLLAHRSRQLVLCSHQRSFGDAQEQAVASTPIDSELPTVLRCLRSYAVVGCSDRLRRLDRGSVFRLDALEGSHGAGALVFQLHSVTVRVRECLFLLVR